jgi:hypothetical protein
MLATQCSTEPERARPIHEQPGAKVQPPKTTFAGDTAMSNANSVNVALAFLTATHNAEQSALNEITRLREENAKLAMAHSKVKASKAKRSNGSQAAPIHDKSTVTGIMLSSATYSESLSSEAKVECAKVFLSAMRDAGKRWIDGKSVRQASEVHNDQIQAISAFIGYDNRVLFGTQDTTARMLAQRILNPKPMTGVDRQVQYKADLSAKGFVAGLPDAVAAKLADLQGREVVAVDAMLAHQKEAADVGRSESDRELSAGLALVEAERAAAIRADIQALTF